MNAYLLFKDRTMRQGILEEQLHDDLEIQILIDGMAKKDSYIKETIRQVFSRENQCRQKEEIIYRQDILKDCIRHEDLIRQFYRQVVEASGKNRDTYLSVTHKKAKYMLDVAVKVMLSMQTPLKVIWQSADTLDGLCHSEGLKQLFRGLKILFDPQRLSEMEDLTKDLSSKNGITAMASPGRHLRAGEYHPLRTSGSFGKEKGILRRFRKERNSLEFDVDMNDPESSPALSRLRDAMSVNAASVVVQARDELFAFLEELRGELSFYIGCLDLKDETDRLKIPLAWPDISIEETGDASPVLSCSDLYNVTLSLQEGQASVPASVICSGKKVILITGPNQGGKTTFLRSVGQALLMMNSGMFVTASGFSARPGQIFTHFIREEDRKLKSGKLDEELIRMSGIIDSIHPGDWILLNESFSSTNEEEGAGIAFEIVSALEDQGIRMAYVTHFYHLVTLLKMHRPDSVLYLNAARGDDGIRTYQLIPGEPVVKGYGEDLYNDIF